MSDFDDFMQEQNTPAQNPAQTVQPAQLPIASPQAFDAFMQNKPTAAVAAGPPVPGADPSSLIRNLPTLVPGMLTGVGAVSGETFGGPFGEIAGSGAGSLAGSALQKLAPSIFGEGPQNLQELIGKTGMDMTAQGLTSFLSKVAGNGLLPTLAGVPGITKLPAVKTAVAGAGLAAGEKKLGDLIYPQSMVLETAAENAQDNWSSGAAINQFGGSGKDLLSVPPTQTTARNLALNKVGDKALSDVTEVRNFKLATGEDDTISQLAMNKLGKKAIKGDGTFDPDAALNELKGQNSDIYDEALKPKVKSTVEDILTTAQSQQKYLKGQKPVLLFKGGDWVLPGVVGTIGSALGGLGEGAATAAGVRISARLIMKAASDPALGQAILVGMKTPATSSAAPLIQRIILHSLAGEGVDLPDQPTK